MPTHDMLTKPGGPVVAGQRTLHALAAIRREKVLGQLHGQVVVSRCNFDALPVKPTDARPWPWLEVRDDQPQGPLPPRCVTATAPEAATIRLALASGASLVLLEGPIKERAKLSFIKCEGVVSILVTAYRQGLISAVPPMLKALTALGFADVLPPPQGIEALERSLREMTSG